MKMQELLKLAVKAAACRITARVGKIRQEINSLINRNFNGHSWVALIFGQRNVKSI